METGKNLHSHLHNSPLSGQQEVSGFAMEDSTDGDTGDNWIVEAKETWRRGKRIRLRHADTSKYLSSDKAYIFRRPISGQQEVACANRKSTNSIWVAEEGIYML